MSLLDSYYNDYNIMNKATVDSSEGGWITEWTAGATVQMALDDPTQTQRLIAASENVEVVRNAVFPIGSPIKLGIYLRSVSSDTLVYYVQTNPVEAPGPSGIQVMKAEVIKSRLTQ